MEVLLLRTPLPMPQMMEKSLENRMILKLLIKDKLKKTLTMMQTEMPQRLMDG
jgi:hypothetical protein